MDFIDRFRRPRHPRPARMIASMIALAVALALSGAAEAAAPPNLSAEWVALPSDTPQRTVVLNEGKSQPFVEIVPRTAFRISGDVLDAKGKLLIPKGTILTGTRERADTRCEVKRRKGNKKFVCVIDGNGDGQFESASTLWLFSELFISGGPASSKSEPLASPAAMIELNPRTEAEHFTIDLFFYNRAELVGRNDVEICIVRGDIKSIWGSATDLRICLRRQFNLKDNAYPFSAHMYGGSVRFVSREKNWINVEIDSPRQDFIF